MSHGAKRALSIIVILGAVGALVWLGMSIRDETTPAEAPLDKIIEKPAGQNTGDSRDTLPDRREEAAEGSYIGQEGLVMPWDFPQRAKAERFINEGQGKEPGTPAYEEIQFGIVLDEEGHLAYFATASTAEDGGMFVGIYEMDTENYEWTRIYRHTYEDKGGETRILRVIGRDGDRLVILADTVDNSPGSCASLLSVGDNEGFGLYSLLIDEDGATGLEDYEVPKEVRTADQQRVESCLETL